MRKNMEKVDHVKKILWYDSLADLSIPKTMLPDKVQDAFINEDKDATLMVIFFDSSMSSDETMDAIEELRSVADKQCYISGMSAVVTDTKNLSDKEVPIYVLIAVILAVIVLSLTMDSALIPVFFLLSIGMAIIYNLGSNVFFGEILLCHTGTCSGTTARCYDGLFHFSCGILMKRTRSVSRMIRRERWLMQFRTP